jgi:hypothetical protein
MKPFSAVLITNPVNIDMPVDPNGRRAEDGQTRPAQSSDANIDENIHGTINKANLSSDSDHWLIGLNYN